MRFVHSRIHNRGIIVTLVTHFLFSHSMNENVIKNLQSGVGVGEV